MFAIGASQRSLETSALQLFHPDRDSIGITVHQLDAIASAVEEHEQATVANVALQICFDNPKSPSKLLRMSMGSA